MFWSANVLAIGLAMFLFFGLPTLKKTVSVEPNIAVWDNLDNTWVSPETIEEMQRDIETGKMIRSLTPSERRTIAPLKTLEETYAERYPTAAGERTPGKGELWYDKEIGELAVTVDEDVPLEFGEPKNGDHAEPVTVQIINAIGDNMTKFMAGLLTLSQILLNFRTFRNRKQKVGT